MAKEYGCRPSAIEQGLAADFIFDIAVWNAAVPILGAIEKDPGKGDGVLVKLRRDAEAERIYRERHGEAANDSGSSDHGARRNARRGRERERVAR